MNGPEIISPNRIEWDQSQRSVIDSCHEGRLLVDAGPGTGKTAVACGRVSQLIGKKLVKPNRILMISFTRAAVREIRNRIRTHLEDTYAAYAVKIGTLDSHAWDICSRFDGEEKAQRSYEEKAQRSYEENIKSALDLIRDDQNQRVSNYLKDIEHLIVDEAQDFVGMRADFVVEFILRLSSKCGVTIFSDEAQAIHGFIDVPYIRGEDRFWKLSFSDKIRGREAGEFNECNLTCVHRTDSPQLQEIFSSTRRKVLTVTKESDSKELDEIREDIKRHAHGKIAVRHNGQEILTPPDQNDALILYRMRGDVLLRSSLLMGEGIQHRVRMSGLPVCLAPWIGAALAEHTGSILSEKRFGELWEDRIQGSPFLSCERDHAWEQLVSIAGCEATIVDMHKLRKHLGRKNPPPELCHAEMGQCGFIIGTIHASKGREADIVHLVLPKMRPNDSNQDEEARVIFVGATRGRSQLLIGEGNSPLFKKVKKSGRAYHHVKDNNLRKGNYLCAQVEIGHDGDINVGGLAGKGFFEHSSDVHVSQERISSFAGKVVSLVVELNSKMNFSYLLKEEGQGKFLAVLSKKVNSDLFCIKDIISNKKKFSGYKLTLPNKICHLHVLGVRTIVVPSDMAEERRQNLHEPWRSSGIMLAPLVLGYSAVCFQYQYKGQKL